jgi:DNA-binding transcriptional ArsR family regulator
MRETEVETPTLRALTTRKQHRFLRGPIPLSDITAASRLPGQALALYVAVHHRRAVIGHPIVTVPSTLLAEFGINRDAKARALRALEEAGLVRVERVQGRGARVEICKREPSDGRDQ